MAPGPKLLFLGQEGPLPRVHAPPPVDVASPGLWATNVGTYCSTGKYHKNRVSVPPAGLMANPAPATTLNSLFCFTGVKMGPAPLGPISHGPRTIPLEGSRLVDFASDPERNCWQLVPL